MTTRLEAAVKAWDHYWGDRYGDEALEEMGDEVKVALEAADAHDAANGVRRVSLDPEKVLAFINQRSEYVQAARNATGCTDDDSDYHRWQGHMEARRQLAEALGYTVPYELGDKTERKPE